MKNLAWRKSGRSSNGGDTCVELARDGALLAARDSKNPHGGQLRFERPEFAGFLAEIKRGTFDL